MKSLKKLVTLFTLAVTLGTSANALNADYCNSNCNTGCGYEDCRSAPSISPTVALGTVAAVAIIAVLVHNRKSSRNGGNGGADANVHSHSHSHS